MTTTEQIDRIAAARAIQAIRDWADSLDEEDLQAAVLAAGIPLDVEVLGGDELEDLAGRVQARLAIGPLVLRWLDSGVQMEDYGPPPDAASDEEVAR